jgi:hypothetical protein
MNGLVTYSVLVTAGKKPVIGAAMFEVGAAYACCTRTKEPMQGEDEFKDVFTAGTWFLVFFLLFVYPTTSPTHPYGLLSLA